MPSQRDNAFAKLLAANKTLPESEVQAALAEVERLAKSGLEKFLSTVLVETGKLTQKQVDKLNAELGLPDPEPPPRPLIDAMESLEAALPEESAGPQAKKERGLLEGVEVCAKCGRVVDEEEIRSGVAVHEGGRLYCAKCRTSELEGGEVAAGFRIGKPLYPTRLGQVYHCRNLAEARDCAVEVIPEQKIGQTIPLNRLVQLGHAAAAFDHGNLLRLHGIVNWQKSIYIEREYCPYFPLDIYLDRHRQQGKGPFSVSITLKVVRQLVEALVYAFDQGVVHGSITPSRIHMNKNAGVKLADLGLLPLGPPVPDCPYAAPELRGTGDTIDSRIDIYSVGIIAWEMLTLQTPPCERTGPLDAPEDTPYFIDHLIEKMTALAIRDRFPMPRHALRQIEECSEKRIALAEKVKLINSEIDELQADMVASVKRKEDAEAELAKLTAKRDAAVDKLKQDAAKPASESPGWLERRAMKRKNKEIDAKVATVEKGFKRQAKEIERTIQAELDKQQSIQRKIGKKIEQREEASREA